MKKLFFILFFGFTIVSAQTFDEIPGEDKSELKYGWYKGGGCGPYGIPPQFPGGEDCLWAFLKENLEWPKNDTCAKVKTKVYISFAVDTDGKLIDIKVRRPGCPLYDNEAIRVISIMPNWIPGTIGGHLEKVNYQLPIIFDPNKD